MVHQTLTQGFRPAVRIGSLASESGPRRGPTLYGLAPWRFRTEQFRVPVIQFAGTRETQSIDFFGLPKWAPGGWHPGRVLEPERPVGPVGGSFGSGDIPERITNLTRLCIKVGSHPEGWKAAKGIVIPNLGR